MRPLSPRFEHCAVHSQLTIAHVGPTTPSTSTTPSIGPTRSAGNITSYDQLQQTSKTLLQLHHDQHFVSVQLNSPTESALCDSYQAMICHLTDSIIATSCKQTFTHEWAFDNQCSRVPHNRSQTHSHLHITKGKCSQTVHSVCFSQH